MSKNKLKALNSLMIKMMSTKGKQKEIKMKEASIKLSQKRKWKK